MKLINCSGEQCSPQDSNRFSLLDVGQIVNISISNISKYYSSEKINKYIIMPNHIHIIMVLEFDNARYTDENWRTLFAPTILRIIKYMKEYDIEQINFFMYKFIIEGKILVNELLSK
ncbi:hypothetical protein [Clostridium argentinense]|uniref:hypothetical protein n=1 Tax=Clostridium argentinense TaxID=29341 RepID=UPI00057C61DD|nr:hypothetical protein [Clostridium argentinense]ARC86428.1 hypothetical protein RSJ17_19005 [Clostridium argentinense]NFF37888.1 hypothetical protein [Clostridium argentinense]NFP49880.1 hypothetical protein [Clostridium argentinense]NFP71280.1 hypothetical protein [Clostridium argentinense]NFP75460.1 hypothetical protein [Clostridium argentinense]